MELLFVSFSPLRPFPHVCLHSQFYCQSFVLPIVFSAILIAGRFIFVSLVVIVTKY